jgi:hypothetical protein
MQHIKDTEKFCLIKEVAHTEVILTDSLSKVIEKFDIVGCFSAFNVLKSRGYAISSLFKTCLILPFAQVASIYAMLKHGISQGLAAKKDAYYAAKNNEFMDWRRLLYMVASRFRQLVGKEINDDQKRVTALIFDDTLLEKTGKGIERVSLTFDHVSKRYVLGYKLLMCAFWDGISLIPLDFTLHRERGSKQEEIINHYHRANKALTQTKGQLKHIHNQLDKHKRSQSLAIAKAESGFVITNHKLQKNAQSKCQILEAEILVLENQMVLDTKAMEDAKQKLKRMYSHGTLFGLKQSERKAQYRKVISAKSCGYTRRKESDRSKGSQLIAMLKRAVKHHFIPQYVLTDSWFFSESLIAGVKSVRNGAIELISMVKINNQVFELDSDKKLIGVQALLKTCLSKKPRVCKQFHASYHKVHCLYKGIPVNLFFIKMGRSSNWHLLATTDLNLNFVNLMKIYQIRWGIEVFFHETKGYLNLGKCQSSNFDAQIADITITLMQYILLSYCKRIYYQTSFGELFRSLSAERLRYNMLTKLLDIFWELVKECSFSAGFDMIIIQRDIMQNPQMVTRIEKLMANTSFNNAA